MLSTLRSRTISRFTQNLRRFSQKMQQEKLKQQMTAAILYNHKTNFKIEKIDVPNPVNNEILVKIHSSGVCHTDVHAADGDWPIPPTLPLIAGHEGAGEVVAVGDNVSHVSIGDRVGIAWLHNTCGNCEYCISGRETACMKQSTTGYSVNGCLSEYAIGYDNYVTRIPDNLEYSQAAPILCAGLTSYKGLKKTQTKPGDWVCIIGGGGGLGHLAVQYAKAMGLNVIATDIGEDKLNFCKSLGADYAFDGRDENVVASVLEASKGGCHACLIVGTSIDAYSKVTQFIRMYGNIVFVGMPVGTVPVSVFETVAKHISYHGSAVGTRQDLNEAMEFAALGKVKCNVEIGSINEIDGIIDKVRKGKVNGRIVINF